MCMLILYAHKDSTLATFYPIYTFWDIYGYVVLGAARTNVPLLINLINGSMQFIC